MLRQSYGVSVENVFAVELSACPSYDEIKKLPNKVLLWCGKKIGSQLRWFVASVGCYFVDSHYGYVLF